MMPKVITSVSKTFAYYADFEKYPKRYPKYCSRLDIIQRNNNEVLTEELWNMTPNKDFDHVKIKVKYILIQDKEIQYEILEGFGVGMKDKFTFEAKEDGMTLVEEPYIPLKIFTEFLKNGNHPLVLHMADHFMWRNMKLLEGKQTGYESGDTCPHCHKGTISYSPQKEITEEKNKSYETERFLCDACNKISVNHKIQVTETVVHF